MMMFSLPGVRAPRGWILPDLLAGMPELNGCPSCNYTGQRRLRDGPGTDSNCHRIMKCVADWHQLTITTWCDLINYMILTISTNWCEITGQQQWCNECKFTSNVRALMSNLKQSIWAGFSCFQLLISLCKIIVFLEQGFPFARELGWVDLIVECSTVCQILPWLMGIWQKLLTSWQRWCSIQIKVNPTHIHEQMGHPVVTLSNSHSVYILSIPISMQGADSP